MLNYTISNGLCYVKPAAYHNIILYLFQAIACLTKGYLILLFAILYASFNNCYVGTQDKYCTIFEFHKLKI